MKKTFITFFLCALAMVLTAQTPAWLTLRRYDVAQVSDWAIHISESCGIKPGILDQWSDLYAQSGINEAVRHQEVELIAYHFSILPDLEREQKSLSQYAIDTLGIAQDQIAQNVLNWHLYSENASGSTSYASGNVKIWYGISPKAFKAIYELVVLNMNYETDVNLILEEQIFRYELLKEEMEAHINDDKYIRHALDLLIDGYFIDISQLFNTFLTDQRYKSAFYYFLIGESESLRKNPMVANLYYQKIIDSESNHCEYFFSIAQNALKYYDYLPAFSYYERTKNINEAYFDKYPERKTLYHWMAARLLMEMGNPQEAVELLQKVIDQINKEPKNHQREMARLYFLMAEASALDKNIDEGIRYLEEAMPVLQQSFDENHPNMAIYYNNLGILFEMKMDFDNAISNYHKSADIFNNCLGRKHGYTKAPRNNLARLANDIGMDYYSKKEYATAITWFENGLNITFETQDTTTQISLFNNLGAMYKCLGQYEPGLQLLEKGILLAEGQDEKTLLDLKNINRIMGPKFDKYIDNQLNTYWIVRMNYHRIGCLIGLQRIPEAKSLYPETLAQAKKIKDTQTITDLKQIHFPWR